MKSREGFVSPFNDVFSLPEESSKRRGDSKSRDPKIIHAKTFWMDNERQHQPTRNQATFLPTRVLFSTNSQNSRKARFNDEVVYLVVVFEVDPLSLSLALSLPPGCNL